MPVKIFNRTIEKLKMRLISYIGDGNSKAFPAMKVSDTHGDENTVIKSEVIGDIQKNAGITLR